MLRYLLVILLLNYGAMIAVSGVIELQSLANKAKEIQVIMRTAADMSLQQTQVIDDYLTYSGRESYKLNMAKSDGSGFAYGDLYGGLWGLDSNVGGNDEKIFKKLYDNNEFKSFLNNTNAIRTPVRYWNESRTELTWYYIPTLAMMGLDILPKTSITSGVIDMSGNYVSESLAEEIRQAYMLYPYKRTTGSEEYYNTPISLGVTYINSDLLGKLFMNNVDLIMRKKYTEYNLNTKEGGNGLLVGETFPQRFKGDLAVSNPINNGVFSTLRGSRTGGDLSFNTFNGITPNIEYKVIDMYDQTNDDILVTLFGANKDGYTSKAQYLKSLDMNVINPVTGMPYTKKPIVVAKITFYLDVVVPYFTVVARDYRSGVDGGDQNFIELKPTNKTGAHGVRRVEYTRYFAVTP